MAEFEPLVLVAGYVLGSALGAGLAARTFGMPRSVIHALAEAGVFFTSVYVSLRTLELSTQDLIIRFGVLLVASFAGAAASRVFMVAGDRVFERTVSYFFGSQPKPFKKARKK